MPTIDAPHTVAELSESPASRDAQVDADLSPEAREESITRHLGLVHQVARTMALASRTMAVIDSGDLVGYGVEGLIHAVDTFNPALNVPFTTWAALHIRTRIKDALRALDPVSRTLRAQGKEIERIRWNLANRLGAWPGDREVAAALGVHPARVRAVTQVINRIVVSLEEVTGQSDGEDAGHTRLDTLAHPDHDAEPERVIERGETCRLMAGAVQRLPERERAVVHMYYHEGLGMRAIAARLGVTESRVSQIHARALDCLRRAMQRAIDNIADPASAAEPPRRRGRPRRLIAAPHLPNASERAPVPLRREPPAALSA